MTTLRCPESTNKVSCVQAEIDSEVAKLEAEGYKALPFLHDSDPTLRTARQNVQVERGKAVFQGTLSQTLCIRAACLEALDEEDIELRRIYLVSLAAMVVASIEAIDAR